MSRIEEPVDFARTAVIMRLRMNTWRCSIVRFTGFGNGAAVAS